MIKLFEQYNEYNQIKEWLDKMEIENYTINDDLTVDVDGNVSITGIELTEIPIQFKRVTGYFDCEFNKITSLKGSPKYVGGIFDCRNNKITSLEGGPDEVMGEFNCSNNKLTTLEYSPKYIGSNFYFYNNRISSLKYIPETLLGSISLYNNRLPYVLDRFRSDYKIITKHQEDYGIWNNDGTLNKGRWDIFVKDYEKGILNND